MKLDSTMTEVAYYPYSGGAPTCLTQDTTHLFLGDYTSPAQAHKILKADMTWVATWEGEDGENQAVRIILVGNFVLMALGSTVPVGATTATVMKINKVTMVSDADYPKWVGGDGEVDCLGIASDGTHLIVSMHINPVKVRKVLIATMTSVGDAWDGIAIQGQINSWNVAVGGGFAYPTFDTSTGSMIRLDVSTLTPMAYQWQRSAADSDAGYSNISGGTTVPYNDTGAPSGAGRYFKCLVDSIGASQQTSSVDSGYRVVSGMARTRVLSLVLWKR